MVRRYRQKSADRKYKGQERWVDFEIESWDQLMKKFEELGPRFIEDYDRVVAKPWGEEAKKRYDEMTGYGTMRVHVNRTNRDYTFHQGFYTTSIRDKFTITVGHEQFVARFLEVGTRSHPVSASGKLYTMKGIRIANWMIPSRTGTWDLQRTLRDEMPNLNDLTARFIQSCMK